LFEIDLEVAKKDLEELPILFATTKSKAASSGKYATATHHCQSRK
jgi:hypothetical protein